MTIAAGETILAADIQAIRDDVDAILTAADDEVTTSETTTSATFTDLATVGPQVSLTTGTTVLVAVKAVLSNNTAAAGAVMSFEVSGASTQAADVDFAISALSDPADQSFEFGAVFLVSGLTAGANTFTAKYSQSGGGTAQFVRRKLIVVPLGD